MTVMMTMMMNERRSLMKCIFRLLYVCCHCVYTLHAVLCRIKMFEMTIKDYSKSTLLIRFNTSYATAD